MAAFYKDIVTLFIELRSKGISLSAMDYEVLQRWSDNHIDPDLIVKVMMETKLVCDEKNKKFPNTLEPISRQVGKVLLKMRET
jgi:hypothetical protein